VWAYDILRLNLFLKDIIPHAIKHFAKDGLWIEEEYGMFWFDFANVVALHSTYEERRVFDAKFEDNILYPVIRCLIKLASTDAERSASLKEWQGKVDLWQIPHLGPLYSNVVLSQLGVNCLNQDPS